MPYQGLVVLIILVADVWAIVNIYKSTGDTGKKFLWTITVLLLPVIGLFAWIFVGPRIGRT
jgi:hypothetical protein